MKRILTLILVLVLAVATLAGCDVADQLQGLIPGGDTTIVECHHVDRNADLICDLCLSAVDAFNKPEDPERPTPEIPAPEADEELQGAYDYVHQLVKGVAEETKSSYDVIKSVSIGNGTYEVKWETSDERITITESKKDNFYTVVIPRSAEKIDYTLKFTVTGENGATLSREYNHYVPATEVVEGGVVDPVVGKAYVFGMVQENCEGQTYYLAGGMDGYYMATTTNKNAAIKVYIEETNGGYYLYTMNGDSKLYINMVVSGSYVNAKYEATASTVYTYSETAQTLVSEVNGEQYWMGTRNDKTYTTVGPCKSSLGSFYCQFYVAPEGGETPDPGTPETPDYSIVTNPEVGTAYKFGLNHGGQGAIDVFFNGQNYNGYAWYLAYATSFAEGVDVYLEAVEGVENAYRLFFYNGEAKTYIVAFPRDGDTTKGTLKLDTTCPTEYFTFNTEYNTLVYTSVTGEQFYLGSSGTYKSISCSGISYISSETSYVSHLYAKGGNEGGNEGGGNEGGNEGGGDVTVDSAVLDLMGNANLVSGSAQQNIFAANGITFTNDKASSTSDLTVQASYAQRAYAGSTIKIQYPGMTKIVLTLDDYSSGKYLKGLDGMIVSGATITRDNDVVTIIFSAATNEFVSNTLPSQIRIEKIEVYTGTVDTPPSGGGNEGGNEGGDTTDYVAPVAGKAYDLFMVLPSGTVYFKGSLDTAKNSYLDTTTDAAASVKIYFEVVDGGYNIYFMNGDVKTYINAEAYLKSNGYAGCHFTLGETATTVWTYDTTYGILEVYGEIDGKSDTFFAGTYGTYTTVSLSGAYYKDQISSGTQFPARIALSEGGAVTPHEHNFVNGKCECGETDPNYVAPEAPTFGVVDPVVGTAYKFGMVQGNLNKTFYLVGGMNGYYMDTTEDASAAINVYLEETTGGYYLYTLDAAGAKLYINMVVSGTHVNGAYEATASTVYTYNTESKTIIASVNGSDYWFGTRNDKTYTTVGPCAVSYAGFYCQFYGTSTVDPQPPVHEHNFVNGKCECGETDPNYVPPHEHNFVDGKCECGETDPNYVAPEAPDYSIVTNPEVGTAYKFGLNHGGQGAIDVFFNGQNYNGYAWYLAYATSFAEGVDVYLEAVEGVENAYRLFFYNGEAKTYIVAFPRDGDTTKGTLKLDTTCPTEYFTFNTEYNTLIYTSVTGEQFYLGSSGTYKSISCSGISYISSNTSYVSHLYAKGGAVTPHEHNFVEGKCECGETDPNYVPPHEHNFVEGKCECGEIDPDYVAPDAPVVNGGSADFNSITLPSGKPNGDSSYTGSYTTANGWVTANSAIQCGGASDMNPQFTVIGADNTFKAVCMNGKVSAPGSITSPTLTGGISKLTINYTKMFTDTKLGATITITEIATGNVYTHTISVELEKNDKYTVYTEEWVLETPVVGDFTIVIKNDCPSQATGNKDRMTILGINWEGAAPATPDPEKFVFADYVVSGELGGGEAVREMGENITFTISSGWINSDTGRIYKNGNAVIESKVALSSIVVNVGYKNSTFDLYVSEDGETWTLYGNYAYTTAYSDVTIDFDTPTKYVKIDAVNQQVRLKELTVVYA